ncbi:YopX family protein [Limosilactobacillus reuteri]|uniref:YopX family protein n=1 Tax=Lactobacillaceae TaxID=33958 RepID=UPI002F26D60D
MIKFRGIPLEDVSEMRCVNFDGDFVYGYYINNGDGALIVGDKTKELDDVGLSRWFVSVDPETVGQFTGLKDVNGKDIYEGDIVHVVTGDGYRRTGKVVFEQEQGCYMVDNGWDKYPFNRFGYERDTLEVLGDVHENPELLEADK